MKKSFRFNALMFFLMIASIMFIGCGGSSSDPAPVTTSYGLAVDPYLVGAQFSEFDSDGDWIQNSTLSDSNGQFSFVNAVSTGSTIKMIKRGTHLGELYTGPILERVVEANPTLVNGKYIASPLTTVVAKGNTASSIATLFTNNGIAISASDIYGDPMAGIDSTTNVLSNVENLQAAIASAAALKVLDSQSGNISDYIPVIADIIKSTVTRTGMPADADNSIVLKTANTVVSYIQSNPAMITDTDEVTWLKSKISKIGAANYILENKDTLGTAVIDTIITDNNLGDIGINASNYFTDLDSDRTLFLSGDSSSSSVGIISEEESISDETLRFTEAEITDKRLQYYYGAASTDINYMIFDSTSGLVGFVEDTDEVDGFGYEITEYGRLKIDADDGIYYIEKTAVNGDIWTTNFWALGDEDNKTVMTISPINTLNITSTELSEKFFYNGYSVLNFKDNSIEVATPDSDGIMSMTGYSFENGILTVTQGTSSHTVYFLATNSTGYDILNIEGIDNRIGDVELSKFTELTSFDLYTDLTASLLNNKSLSTSATEYINFYDDNSLFNSMDSLEGTWSLVDYAGRKIIKVQYATEYEFVFLHSDSVFTNAQSVKVSVLTDNEDNLLDGDSLRLSLTYGEIISDFAGGRGTEASPYQVATAEQLNKVRDHLDKHFIQTANIDLSGYSAGEGWMPIGDRSGSNASNYSDTSFTGVYDGGNFTISNLTINRPNWGDTWVEGSDKYGLGLFGFINGSTIKNLNISNIDITGQFAVGSIAGYIWDSDISDCEVSTGSVKGIRNVGGLIGYALYDSNIKRCSTDVAVSKAPEKADPSDPGGPSMTYSGFGGFIGINGNPTSDWNNVSLIENCYSRGSVTSSDMTGGFAGINQYYGNIVNCYSTGNVSVDITPVEASTRVGGFIGMINIPSTISGFCDSDTSGLVYAVGNNGDSDNYKKTTAQMQTDTPFTGWTTDIWQFAAGQYPTLK